VGLLACVLLHIISLCKRKIMLREAPDWYNEPRVIVKEFELKGFEGRKHNNDVCWTAIALHSGNQKRLAEAAPKVTGIGLFI